MGKKKSLNVSFKYFIQGNYKIITGSINYKK